MIRRWYIPNYKQAVFDEALDHVEGWSILWYCSECGSKYAEAQIEGKPWTAVGGCCPFHEGNKWNIPGSIETIRFVGWKVPLEIALYQLKAELKFLDSPQHPYNKKESIE